MSVASPDTGQTRYAFRGSEILVRIDTQAPGGMAQFDSTDAPLPEPAEILHLGAQACAESFPPQFDPPDGWVWTPFRSVIGSMAQPSWHQVAKALALLNWRAATRYCGRCGAPNGDKPDELARWCPACGAISYPRISPAVLAVVRRDDKILLARNAMNKTGMWSILAGFVEPGETLEACVRREVLEEVSVEVDVHGYLGSQPWPFPDQLMIGMHATWRSGELAPDGVEIAEAGWFGSDDHPPLPMHGSLSRALIDAVFADISGAGIRR
ncbi:MAG TPA: NAD(+) diphosphatase [bacterium]|nr:NAD(+) diphosphatase [bacterium]